MKTSNKLLDTSILSLSIRKKIIDKTNKRILISNLNNSAQRNDLKKAPNCEGYGRIRHFKLVHDENWVNDPLPIFPANKYLNTNYVDGIEAQVFQIGGCNFRCWYCFVDTKLISGRTDQGEFYNCEELIDLYLNQSNPPRVIDLSGGQPDLVPEWTLWMMQALIKNGLENNTLLWSDDNLSNDYFWKYLSKKEIKFIESYNNYARVCCFKGIDEKSFSLNTSVSENLFDYQFQLFKRLHKLNIDLYGYITLTSPTDTDFKSIIPRLFDKLQEIHENLPLRIIPLKIETYTPVKSRISDNHDDLLNGQMIAVEYWKDELFKRFSQSKLDMNITDISI